MLVAVAVLIAQGHTLVVGADGGDYPTITAAVTAAAPGDTIRVRPGLYREHLEITTPVTLLGDPGAVIYGGGTGIVVHVRARATLNGFTIRASGDRLVTEDAGVMITAADGTVIEGNVLEDVLFGVYVKESDSVRIIDNVIEGKPLDVPRRGDGIRLWYSHFGSIEGNRLRRVRDLVIWFSNDTFVRRNRVRDSRYGLHFMYSHRNRFQDNEFLGNHVGGFLMYSSDITFHHNVFAHSRGASGKGLAFKDTDRIEATANVMVKNAIGIALDNSPTDRDAVNQFRGNLVAFNDVGVSLLPSVQRNHFVSNTFLDNVQPVAVSGGGSALRNAWRENYWSEYAGFDANDDARGDTPFRHDRLSDDLMAEHEGLRLYELSPATVVLNAVGRAFPLLQPEPVVIDSSPRLDRRNEGTPNVPPDQTTRPSAPLGAAFAVLSVMSAFAARRWSRPRWRT